MYRSPVAARHPLTNTGGGKICAVGMVEDDGRDRGFRVHHHAVGESDTDLRRIEQLEDRYDWLRVHWLQANGDDPAAVDTAIAVADSIGQTIPAVRRTVPVKQVRKEGRLGEQSLELRVMGTTAQWFLLVSRPLLAGRGLRYCDQAVQSGRPGEDNKKRLPMPPGGIGLSGDGRAPES